MYLKVKAITKAKKEYVERLSADEYLVSVKVPPERNLANIKIIELLAHELGVTPSSLRMIKGHHFSSKIVELM